MQAQPSFAQTNLVSDLGESSGPVEQLKSKFFGPQVYIERGLTSGDGGGLLTVDQLVHCSFAAVAVPMQDATSQRKALGDDIGDNTTGGFDELGIGRQEDATIDNPNDSPRPKDRTRMGTADAQRECGVLHDTLQ